MELAQKKSEFSVTGALLVIFGGLIGLYFLGHFDAVPERSEANQDGVFLYYGPEAETVFEPGLDAQTQITAEEALKDAAYFAAFAAGPYQKSGAWVGAHSLDLARSYALAECGDDCHVVATRLPLHRDPTRSEPVATEAMARNLAIRWPFTRDYIALGGAGAWGHKHKPAGRHTRARAMRQAGADCEARRALETVANPALSAPCTIQPLKEFIDLRPKPALYPARFTVGLTALTPVAETEVVEMPGAPSRWITPYMPKGLHGARADNGETSYDVVRNAGWPAAGAQIALTKCNAARRPGEPDCVVSHVRIPENDVPSDRLAVTPGVYEAYQVWLARDGAGAFAIGPYGAWGSAFDHPSVEAAMQKAADWCWYHTRKSWAYRQVDNAFLDADVHCRIVAVTE